MSPWEGSSRSGLGLIGGSEVRLTQEGDAVHEDTEDYGNAGGGDGDDDDDDDENDDDDDDLYTRRHGWAQSQWHSSSSTCACTDALQLPGDSNDNVHDNEDDASDSVNKPYQKGRDPLEPPSASSPVPAQPRPQPVDN